MKKLILVWCLALTPHVVYGQQDSNVQSSPLVPILGYTFTANPGAHPSEEVKVSQEIVYYNPFSPDARVMELARGIVAEATSNPALHSEILVSTALKSGSAYLSAGNAMAQELIHSAAESTLGLQAPIDIVPLSSYDPVQRELMRVEDVGVYLATIPSVVSTAMVEGREEISVLSITRVTVGGIANALMIYAATGSDAALPAVAAAAVFFPFQEYVFQAGTDRYLEWLKRSPSVEGRLARRWIVSAVVIGAHQFLMAKANLVAFDTMSFLWATSSTALATHPFWELAVREKEKPRLFEGKTVAFSLGVVGAVGLVLQANNLAAGEVVMGALLVGGGVSWAYTIGMEQLVASTKQLLAKANVRVGSVIGDACDKLRSYFQSPN